MTICMDLYKEFYENKDKQYDYLNPNEKNAINIQLLKLLKLNVVHTENQDIKFLSNYDVLIGNFILEYKEIFNYDTIK